MLFEQIVVYFEALRAQILDGEDCCGASVALGKGVSRFATPFKRIRPRMTLAERVRKRELRRKRRLL